MKAQILAVTVALTLAGCGGGSSSPSSPSSPPPPPAPAAVAAWTVTQSFVSVTGPDNCWVRQQRSRWTGAVFANLPMTVTRSASAISVDGDFFQVNYTGIISGNEFSANGRQPLEGGGTTCPDGASVQQRPGVSSLSGSFSADDRVMSASEVNSYTLSSGEPVVYTWAWRATR
jgi:hypothetical protein